MTPTVRRRVTKVDNLDHTSRYFYQNNLEGENKRNLAIRSRQITVSEGHAWPKDRGVRDAGGDFDTLKLTYTNKDRHTYRSDYVHSIFPAYTTGNNFPGVGDEPGAFVTDGQSDDFYRAWVPCSSETALMAQGTKFVASTLPTNPIVDASVGLAELYREGIPSMIGAGLLKDRLKVLRGGAGEYLNFQFGWKPLVADVRNAAKAIMEQEQILSQLKRDSGRDVHRKRILPTTTLSTDVRETPYVYASGHYGSAFSGPQWYRVSDVVKRRTWFSGCYTYHFEPALDSEVTRIAKEARLLYGLELTPEVLWNLAPWSWLVDWVSNVGSVFHNVSAFQQDGLVMRYGYIMEYNSRTLQRSNRRGAMVNGTSSYPLDSADVFSGIRKLRRKATPYGFGLLESGFNTRQWAILAALGITRAPKHL